MCTTTGVHDRLLRSAVHAMPGARRQRESQQQAGHVAMPATDACQPSHNQQQQRALAPLAPPRQLTGMHSLLLLSLGTHSGRVPHLQLPTAPDAKMHNTNCNSMQSIESAGPMITAGAATPLLLD
jgi:hypothetical protein